MKLGSARTVDEQDKAEQFVPLSGHLNFLTYFYSTSIYFLAFASFSPRIVDLLTDGTEVFSLRASADMVIPSSLTAQ
jgi:hypothetical protein